MLIQRDEPLAVQVTEAIQGGDLDEIRRLLAEHPGLARARLVERRAEDGCEVQRTLLHVATDYPGHFPDSAATVSLLIEAGAEVNAPFVGFHQETPLHWAASTDDVAVIDALLDHGADIEAPGSVIGGGSPLADAVAFGQWRAARRMTERGAQANLWQAAALGLMDTVEQRLAAAPPPTVDEVTNAFWFACHGGQLAAAKRLQACGAELNWAGHGEQTPLDAALGHGAEDVVAWLRGQGAKTAAQLV